MGSAMQRDTQRIAMMKGYHGHEPSWIRHVVVNGNILWIVRMRDHSLDSKHLYKLKTRSINGY